MKYYVQDWGRPCGVEPKIYTKIPETPEYSQFDPEVLEFNTELEARVFIKKYNPDGYKEKFK